MRYLSRLCFVGREITQLEITGWVDVYRDRNRERGVRKRGGGRGRERKTAGGSSKDLPPRFRLKIKSYVRVRVGSREITAEFCS